MFCKARLPLGTLLVVIASIVPKWGGSTLNRTAATAGQTEGTCLPLRQALSSLVPDLHTQISSTAICSVSTTSISKNIARANIAVRATAIKRVHSFVTLTKRFLRSYPYRAELDSLSLKAESWQSTSTLSAVSRSEVSNVFSHQTSADAS